MAKAVLRRSPEPVRRVLSRGAWRTYERWLALKDRNGPSEGPDGLPVPPARLRVLVSRSAHLGAFINSGAMESGAIRGLAARHGSPIEKMSAILDFGCGCGRIARHWAALGRVRVCGSDYNRELVAWCKENLPFMDTRLNEPRPPLPFDGPFDLVYAISVFTHLTEPMQHAWIQECRRVLAPGGVLIFTTLGERYADRFSAEERAQFERGKLVTRFDEVEGSNLCVAYHPHGFVQRMLAGFQLRESIRSGVEGVFSNSPLSLQDVHVARRD